MARAHSAEAEDTDGGPEPMRKSVSER